MHVLNLVTAKLLFFITFQEAARNNVQLNECTHGHVGSRTSHNFEALGAVMVWPGSKFVGDVTSFSAEDEYTMVVKSQHVFGQYFENCLRTQVYMKIFLVLVWGTESSIC